MRLYADRRQHNSSVALRWAPEIAPGNGPCEREQSIDNPIVEPDHSVQHSFKPIERLSEREKVEPVPALFAPRHGSTQHERRRIKTFLCRAADVCRGGRVGNLLIVFEATTNRVIAVQNIECHELTEIVYPSLHGRET